MPRPLATLQAPWRAALPDRVLLWLALLQGSSMTLSLALNLPGGPDPTLAMLVSRLWILMYAYALVALFVAFGPSWVSWVLRYRLLLVVLVGGAALSALWSIDPRLSAERGIHLVGTTVVALYIGFRLPLATILGTCARAFAVLLVLSALAALFVPALGVEEYLGRAVWRGVTASKNTLGFLAAVATLLFAMRAASARTLGDRAANAAFAALGLVCLAASVSATSVLAFSIALVIVLYVHAATGLRLGPAAIAVLGALVVALVALAVRGIDTAELIGRSDDLTGRAQVWSEVWRLILERPYGGFGYGTLWFPTERSVAIQQSLTDLQWTVQHAHNGLLQIASEIGLPLCAAAVLLCLQQLVELVWYQSRRPEPGVLFALGFSGALLVSNYAEARLLVSRDLLWILFVALPISLLRQITLAAGDPANAAFAGGLVGRHEHRVHRRALKRRLRERRDARVPERTAANAAARPTTGPTTGPATGPATERARGTAEARRARKRARRRRPTVGLTEER